MHWQILIYIRSTISSFIDPTIVNQFFKQSPIPAFNKHNINWIIVLFVIHCVGNRTLSLYTMKQLKPYSFSFSFTSRYQPSSIYQNGWNTSILLFRLFSKCHRQQSTLLLHRQIPYSCLKLFSLTISLTIYLQLCIRFLMMQEWVSTSISSTKDSIIQTCAGTPQQFSNVCISADTRGFIKEWTSTMSSSASKPLS